ncbi:MAG: MFS transporter [Acutalibacteraceae bacterium]|nr:MFS transporter [Acutalibacteraceae bacterium]
MKLSSAAKRAVMIGSVCSCAYLAVYIARNILGAVTPQLIEKNILTTEIIGSLSSLYFICYALGQLINGRIGDKIKTKYMVSLGLLMAGISTVLFSLIYKSTAALFIVYGFTGYFLSMIYGPMTKLVSENTEPLYATRCSLGYTFASFFGSPLAGFLAALFAWNDTFKISGLILAIMAIISFSLFTVYEKKGLIQYNKYSAPKDKGNGISVLIERGIVKFTVISIVTGVVRTSVVFWLPTYISQRLGFSAENAALIYTIATLAISATPFIAIFIYERLNMNMNLTILLSFSASSVFFLMVYIMTDPLPNVIFLVLSIMASNCAASMLWSRYCPSLYDTGMVSTATGFLDFVSYMAAAISSTVFANAVSSIGWSNLILIWMALMLIGVAISVPYKKLFGR